MEKRSAIFLKVLLNTFHPGPVDPLLKVLPADVAKETAAVDVSSKKADLGLMWLGEVLARTHYSWLVPTVERLPKGIVPSVVAAMPEAQAKGLQKLLKLTELSMSLPTILKQILLKKFYDVWRPEGIPVEYLSSTPLGQLLTLSKSELVETIDLLALYDLSEALRQVVDTKKLKQLYSCLSETKQQFLRQCLQKKDKIAAPKLEIERWDGKQESFDGVLHRRGLLRLGKALCGQSQQFIWHVKHTLDTGRGEIISTYYSEKSTPEVTQMLAQQLLSVINFIKQKNSS